MTFIVGSLIRDVPVIQYHYGAVVPMLYGTIRTSHYQRVSHHYPGIIYGVSTPHIMQM